MFSPICHNFLKSSYIGTVVCIYVCIYMHTCIDSVPRSADPLPFELSCSYFSLAGFIFSSEALIHWICGGTFLVQTRVSMAEFFQN